MTQPHLPQRTFQLLRRVPEEDRQRLMRRVRASDPAELLRTLTDGDAIRARWDELESTARRALIDTLVGRARLDHAALAGPARRLVASGLALRTRQGTARSTEVSAEVLVALRDELPEDSQPLLACLTRMNHRESQEFFARLEIHTPPGAPAPRDDDMSDDGVFAGDDPGAALDAHLLCIEHLLSPDHLNSLLDSLSATARNLLLFASQWAGPIPAERLDDVGQKLAARFGDSTGARHLLQFCGLLYPMGSGRLVLPVDLNLALAPHFESDLADRCGEAWIRLRVDHTPAYRDVFPRGMGGDPLQVARYRVLRALRHPLDLHHPADALLYGLGLTHSLDGDLHPDLRECLDVSGPEPFGREILRIWQQNVHPEFDSELIDRLGGDARRLLVPTLGVSEARAPEEVEALLVLLHTHLIVALGILPPGYWFRIDRMAEWAVWLYRMVAWRTLPPERGDTPALPAVAVEVTAEMQPVFRTWLLSTMQRVLEPLAAVRLDESRELFMVNTEPLRVLGDEDPDFTDIWRDAERILGDEIDLWIPRPVDHGPRISGVGPMRWDAGNRLTTARSCHFHDLLALTDIAIPQLDGDGIAFEFSHATVSEPLHERTWWLLAPSERTPPTRPFADPRPLWSERLFELRPSFDARLVWLATRSGAPVPSAIRALFPLSQATVDLGDDAVEQARQSEVDALLGELEDIDAQGARAVLEAIRAWGDAACGPVAEALTRAATRNTAHEDQRFYLSLLAGELGAVEALPALQRLFLETEDPILHDATMLAMARIGADAVPWLAERCKVTNPEINDRFLAVDALSIVAILHPEHCGAITGELIEAVHAGDLEPRDATLLAVRIAETGHPDGAELIRQLHERQLWEEEILPMDEALWINSLAPAVHSRSAVAPPFAGIFNPLTTSEHVTEFLVKWNFAPDPDDPDGPPWHEYHAQLAAQTGKTVGDPTRKR